MSIEQFRHIVVEGPIGVGKTSFAKRLAAQLDAQLLLELPGENPFLPKFYEHGQRYALATQLCFLFQRVEQLRDLAQFDFFQQVFVADFLLEKDPLFARMTLSDDEYLLYRTIFNNVRPQVPKPDLVILLQAQTDTLVARVRRRAVPMESYISEDYLGRVNQAYADYFHHYDEAPLLIVNTEHLNPIASDADYGLLIDQIGNMRSRREFFNIA
ncbi:MAG: deoxynucleoside kinase [Burkholderiaceae bacterium]